MNFRAFCGIFCLWLAVSTFEQARAEDQRTVPSVIAVAANFYYYDLDAARTWYVEKLGFRPVYDGDWLVMVEVAPGMQIALVDGSQGSLKPAEEKSAMLTIETDELEEWFRYVSRIEGIEWFGYGNDNTDTLHRIRDHEMIQEFRVLDPGGYIIEFYRWNPAFRPTVGSHATGDRPVGTNAITDP